MTQAGDDFDAEVLVGRLRARAAGPGRTVCAIAGAPGSGKSTLAEALVERLNDASQGGAEGTAALLPMDGFHFDDLHLVPAVLRPRKGAPETFDVGGLRALLERLRVASEPFVAVPVFDRSIEIARGGARLIPREVPVIVCEGNWLLLDREPWSALRPLFDVTVMIDVPEAELRRRLRARWEGYGLSHDEIVWKLDGNDLPNGRLVRDGSAVADLVMWSRKFSARRVAEIDAGRGCPCPNAASARRPGAWERRCRLDNRMGRCPVPIKSLEARHERQHHSVMPSL